MAGSIETKKNRNYEIYVKNSSGEVRRAAAFTPEGGVVIGAAAKGSVGSIDANVKLHRGASGLQFVKETDDTPDGVSAPYENLAFVTMIESGELIVGSVDQVDAGNATHATLSDAIADANEGDVIYILELDSPITEGSNITLDKRLTILGTGNGSNISDNFLLSSTASKSLIKNVRFGADLVVQTNCNNIIMTDCWASPTSSFTDNGTNNLITILQEV